MSLRRRVRENVAHALWISVTVALVLAGCMMPPPTRDADASATAAVRMENIRFQPSPLHVQPGTTVTWTNDDAAPHTVTPTDTDLWGTPGGGSVDDMLARGETWSFTFDDEGVFDYYCIPHAFQAADGTWSGMVGTVVVANEAPAEFTLPATTVVRSPIAPARTLPDADGIVRFHLTTTEVVAQLDDQSAFEFWTFDGTVPGPMLRVREGDRVEITISNDAASTHAHSIDSHSVTGPGGGAGATQTDPGQTTSFTFTASHPGVFEYHCATAHIPTHVANGMYGFFVVEPAAGWPPVDHEYYVVQGEAYTAADAGSSGLQTFSAERMVDEDPAYVFFNGRVGALTGANALTAEVGETVRIFFGVGGFKTSSFHVIGEIFDRAWPDGNVPMSEHRQTVMVPASGAYVVEMRMDYPGSYILVDHTLTRAIDKGAVGVLAVTGDADPAIFDPGSGGSSESGH